MIVKNIFCKNIAFFVCLKSFVFELKKISMANAAKMGKAVNTIMGSPLVDTNKHKRQSRDIYIISFSLFCEFASFE